LECHLVSKLPIGGVLVLKSPVLYDCLLVRERREYLSLLGKLI
jgi:hypothetical protein